MDEWQKKFEIFKVVVDLSEKEADRTWARYRMMLFIQSALGVIASFKYTENHEPVFIAICAFGVIFSVVWYYIFVWSLYGQDRWIKDQIAIINQDELLSSLIKGRTNKRITRPEIISARKLFLIPPMCFGSVWLGMFCFCLYKLLCP